MKERIKLEEIVGYLPYGLKYLDNENIVTELKCVDNDIQYVNFGWGYAKELKQIKPILRPPSDLTKEIEVNGEKFVPLVELETTFGYEYLYSYIYKNQGYFNKYAVHFGCLSYLQKWHFDIHNLIERGLAIDINTLEK
jgi:hypothetical protein